MPKLKPNSIYDRGMVIVGNKRVNLITAMGAMDEGIRYSTTMQWHLKNSSDQGFVNAYAQAHFTRFGVAFCVKD